MKLNFFLMIFVAFFSLATSLYADDAVLEWDENSDADYYVVYWSTDPGNFSEVNSVEVPADLTYVDLEDSYDGREYYISVKAFNACGNSSDFSESVKTAHIPVEGSVGEAIDLGGVIDGGSSNDGAAASKMGFQGETSGCFIQVLR